MTTAEEALRAMQRLAFTEIAQVLGDGGLVVIAPHPDDESLACGGLISRACAQGRAVRIIVVSDGTGSHPRSRRYPRDQLRVLREAEARRAASALGLAPRHVEFLRLPDRFVPSEGPAAVRAVERIVAAAKDVRAAALFVSWRHDPHCDHEAAYRLARAACQRFNAPLYEYSVWGAALDPLSSVSAVTEGFRIDVGPHRVRKRRAIAAHRSQLGGLIPDDPTGFTLSRKHLLRFLGPYESFIAGAS